MTNLPIRANCPEHGDIRSNPSEFLAIADLGGVLSGYTLRCPEGDHHLIYRETSERTMNLLISSGVVVVVYDSNIIKDTENHQRIDNRFGPLRPDEIINLYENIKEKIEQLYDEAK